MIRVLLVDDDPGIRLGLGTALEAEGFEVVTAGTGEEAVQLAREKPPDAAIVDLKLPDPDMDGIAVVRTLKTIDPDMPVLVITAYANLETAIEAIREGAYDYIKKPASQEEILDRLHRALERRRILEENRRLRAALPSRAPTLIAVSPKMQEVLALARQAASDPDAPILITGETGVGKGMLARYIHFHSPRARGPFVEVPCTDIPETLFESEMFGHRKGAFTDAREDRVGKVETADGGTLFLDEIGDLPLKVQSKLLHLVEQKEFFRLGEDRPRRVDLRIISATNRDLRTLIREGKFRQDLFYRLLVFEIHIPPLRERKEDIRPLALHFLRIHARRKGKPIREISEEAIRMLEEYPWPGNVRELENAVERAVIMAQNSVLTPRDFRLVPLSPSPPRPQLRRPDREELRCLLEEHGWNITRAAEALGVHRTTLHRWIREMGLKREA